MKFPSLKDLFAKAGEAFKRFPVVLLWSFGGAAYIIGLIETEYNDDRAINIVTTLVLGISWLISARFFIEQQEKPKKFIWLQPLVILCLGGYYMLQSGNDDWKDMNVMYFLLFFIAGHSLLFLAPFIGFWNRASWWNYVKTMFFAIGRSAIFSGVLYLGLIIALLAIENLFNVDVPGRWFMELFVLCLGVVNTWVYLSDFPKDIREQQEIHFVKPLEVFVKYILIPLLVLYLIILYAYAIKILIQWELPKGWVSYLVMALAAVGLLIHMAIDPVRESHASRLIRKFYPTFYLLLSPLLILLFVAIGRRVSDYGITVPRYFVIAIALWLTGLTLYLLFSKKKKLKVVFVSAFFIALLSSFGPWGAIGISASSQLSRLEGAFSKIKDSTKISYNKAQDIQSMVSSLKDYGRMGAVKSVFPLSNETWDNLEAKNTYLSVNNILDELDIKISSYNDNEVIDARAMATYNISQSYQDDNQLVDIAGYDYMIPFNTDWGGHKTNLESLPDNTHIKWDFKEFQLEISPVEAPVKRIDLKAFVQHLTKRNDSWNVPVEEVTFLYTSESIDLKIIFETLNLQKPVERDLEWKRAVGTLYIKMK